MDIQLMKCYAKTGKVLYVNSIVMRTFNVHEGKMFLRRVRRKLLSILRGVKASGIANMMVYSPFTMPVHHISIARELNEIALRLQVRRCIHKLKMNKDIIWVACPGAAAAALKLPHEKLVYQRSDRYEEFPGVDSKQIRRCDQLLKEHADLVIYVNRELLVQEKAECRKAIFLGHGVDYEVFANANGNQYVPEEMKQIPRPIIGFYGGLDEHTTDIPLIAKIADLLRNLSIVVIGSSNVDLSVLSSRKNVHLLQQKTYEQIPHYGKCFDAAIMPWRQNRWIEACNPIKLKEYLALGKPVISTPFPELEEYNDIVYVAKTPETFAECVKRALEEDCSERVAARRRRVQDSSWDSKAELVLSQLFPESITSRAKSGARAS